MKKIILFISLFIISTFSFGQHEKIDSLLTLSKESKLDSLKLAYLSRITSYYQTNDIELATVYNDSLYINSKKLGMTRFELLYFVQKGVIEFRQTKYKKALSTWKEGLKHEEIDLYPIQQANLYNNLSAVYSSFNEKDSVLKFSLKSLKMNKKNKNEVGLIGDFYSLANFHVGYFEYDNAIKYIKELQKIALKTEDHIAMGKSYVLLGRISRQEYDFKDSEKLYRKAISIYKDKEPDNIVMIRGLTIQALISIYEDERFTDALKEFLKLKKENDEKIIDEYKWLIIDAYVLSCYNRLGDINKGKKLYETILKSYEETQKLNGTDNIIPNSLSEYEVLTKQISTKTINRLTTLLENSNKKGYFQSKSLTYKNISDYYNLLGDKNKAYLNLKKSSILQDSLNSEKASTVNLSLKRKFNEDLKEKENLQLKADNIEQELLTQQANTRNWFLIIGLLAISVLAFLIWRRYKSEAKAKQIISNQKDKIEQQKNLVETLQKELHHRMKNNLSFIDLFINLAKGRFQDKAYQTKLNELQNRMRSMFEVHKQLFKKEDVTAVKAKNYIDTLIANVQEAYTKGNITIANKTDVEETILSNTSFPVGLIVNEFVTNSYKYAFNDDDSGVIDIALTSDDNEYKLALKDNGKGLPEGFNIENLDSFGLETIQLLTKEYGGTFLIDGSNGVTMNITLPRTAA